MDFIEKIKAAGVVGAGGAGFPTHVKLNAKANCYIVNAAECEPLIETDKYLCRSFPDRIVQAAVKIAEHLGSERTVVALKDKYKAEIEAGKTEAAKKSAYRKLLETSGIDPKRIDAVMRVSDVSTIEVGEDGNIVDADKVAEQIKTDWSDFVISTGTVGQRVDTPPAKQQGKPEPTNLAEALHQKYNI